MSWGLNIRGTLQKNTFYALFAFVFVTVSLIASPVIASVNTKTNVLSTPSNLQGQFIKSSQSPTIYLVSDSKKFAAPAELVNDFLPLGSVLTIGDDELESISPGGTLSRVVGSTTSADVYLVVSGNLHRFPSCDIVQEYGYSCTGIPKLTSQQISRFGNASAVSNFIKGTYSSTVYFVIDGQKRPVPSWGDLVGLGFPIAINQFLDSFVNSIPTGDVVLGSGELVKSARSETVYAINNWGGTLSVYRVTSFGNTIDLGLGATVRTISEGRLAQYEVGQSLKTTLKCGSTNYVGLNGLLYRVDPSVYSQFNLTEELFIQAGDICNRFEYSQAQLPRFVLNKGTIFYIENGTKRPFTSYDAYLENGGNSSNTIAVGDEFVNRLPNGSAIRPTTPRGEVAIANDIFARLNAERAARGLHSLNWNGFLNSTARSWSIQMANSNNFSHSNLYPLLGTFHTAAENIGLGGRGTTSGALHNAWMNSSGHRANLLARNLDVIGLGVYCAPDGRLWVTQQFGRWPNSALPTTFGPVPSVNPIVMNDGGGATC